MPRSTLMPDDRELIEAPNVCHVSIATDDGTIQTVVVWCDLDGDDVVLNSMVGRAWPENLRRAGRATLTVVNLDNPQQYVSIAGRLTEHTREGAGEVVNALARKYTGRDYAGDRDNRVTLRIAPERVSRRDG